jgi:hypothetical protein
LAQSECYTISFANLAESKPVISWIRDNTNANTLDASGVSLSILCVAHCLAVPIIAATAPMLAPGLSEFFGLSHAWHIGLFALAAPVSLFGLVWGTKITKAGWPIIAFGILGLSLMALGAAHLFSALTETAITLLGVAILAGSHIANWRARTQKGHVHENECNLCEDHDHA